MKKFVKLYILIGFIIVMIIGLNWPTNNNLLSGKKIIEISFKDYGKMELELDADTAPITVTNFIKLVESEFYNGKTMHRIIDGFMIQGGDPRGDGTGGPRYSIKGEFTSNGFKNDLKHVRGVISMARSMNPNSAGSQFFIMHKDSPHLDGQYASFGKVIEGIEVVYDIASEYVDYSDRPQVDQVIKSMTVETFGVNYPEPEKL